MFLCTTVLNKCTKSVKSTHDEVLFVKNTGSSQSYKNSHRRCSVRKGVLRNLAKFTGKHLCQSLFFNQRLFIKNETLAQVFFCEVCKISKNTDFTEHHWTTASEVSSQKNVPNFWKFYEKYVDFTLASFYHGECTAQKMKFPIKDFFSKCDQIRFGHIYRSNR